MSALWPFCLTVVGLLVCGCTPMLLGLRPNRELSEQESSEFQVATGEDFRHTDQTVAVVCFAPTELKWKFPKIDDQVSAYVADHLGRNQVKIIAPQYVRSWKDQNANSRDALSLAQQYHAGYVVMIDLTDFTLFEGASTSLYRGHTQAELSVLKINEQHQADAIFFRAVSFAYPEEVPRSSFDAPLNQFQSEYLEHLARKIGTILISPDTSK